MTESKVSGADRLRPRRWAFASCVFDEASWSLTVDGRRVAIEAKPLELLRELLARAGNVVSKNELLDSIWPNVMVVEASLPTAVRKLRVALGDDRRERSIIETIPGIGYRLAVPVKVEDLSAASSRPAAVTELAGSSGDQEVSVPIQSVARRSASRVPRLLAMAAAVAFTFFAISLAFTPSPNISAKTAPPSYSQRDAANALRRLDIGAIERMIAAGWNPNTPFDSEGNGAINIALNMCEWDRGHDRRRLMLMVRTLIEGGAQIDRRNVWGDTAYSIAKAPRYCGADHPVTRMLHTSCFAGFQSYGDRCLATYEIARRNRARGRRS